MKKALGGLVFLAVFAALLKGWTCIHIYQPTFLNDSAPFILNMPRAAFGLELAKIENPTMDQYAFRDPESVDFTTGISDIFPTNSFSSWEDTFAADLADLREALAKTTIAQASQDELMARYTDMRHKMNTFADQNGNGLSLYSDRYVKDVTFDWTPYQPVQEQLPREFVLYAQGAASYRTNHLSEARQDWQSLLALPPEQRHYRSTWATYMLGKANLVKEVTRVAYDMRDYGGGIHYSYGMIRDATQAIDYFQQTKELARQGFADTAGLAKDSDGWIAHAETLRGNYKAAIHLYYQLNQDGSETTFDLDVVCKSLSKEWNIHSLLDDRLCRQVITAWVLSTESLREFEKWYDAVKDSGVELSGFEAERFAWIAYNLNHLDEARNLLSKTETLTAEGKWLLSKLLLREGKIDDAMAILKELVSTFEAPANYETLGTLGLLHFGRKQYVEALDLFVKANAGDDAFFVAESILTAEELEEYIQNNLKYLQEDYEEKTKPEEHHYHYTFVSLADSLSSKYARQGNWKKALEYTPFPQEMSKYIEALNKMKAPALSKRDRAETYFQAAEILWEWGVQLGFYEAHQPDRFEDPMTFNENTNKLMGIVSKSLVNLLLVNQEERARVEKNTLRGEQSDSRYAAADLMWQCAGMLPDNDPLLAQALYKGGGYLKYKEPKSADKFYKALVRRCRKLPLGQEADRLHWFPKSMEISDATEVTDSDS